MRFLALFISSLMLLVIGGIIFLFEYRRRIVLSRYEKTSMTEHHLRELFNAQFEMQQQTMQNIGREIHDNVGQKLTLAALYSQQIDHEKRYPQINDRILAVSDLINESLSELRNLSKSLTSDYIDQTDLIDLIKKEGERVNSSGHCTVKFTSSINNLDVSYNVKNIVTRIIQEFIQNSLKHAECSSMNINIDETNNGMRILIEDNGKGFIESETDGKGIGLNNIKKRAEAISASVIIESTPGKGTSMQLFFPVDKIN